MNSSDWLLARQLRNKMVHEYTEDLTILADALNTASQFSPMLDQFAEQLIQALHERNLLPDSREKS